MFDFSRIYGHANTTFTHSSTTIPLSTKSGTKTTLSDLIKETTPQCYLNPLLFNGHLQTCWTAINTAAPQIHYKRAIFDSNHAVYTGQFAVDFVIPATNSESTPDDPSLPPRTTHYTASEFASIGSSDAKPMLIVLHGLSGGSHEVYVRHVIAPLVEQGWEACVVNSRGCALSKLTSSYLYNARTTWDVRQVVGWCRERFPERKLFGIGFSLGANMMVNYLGEEGEHCPLKAAVVCSNPWNLELSFNALQQSTIGLELYLRTLGGNVKKLWELHKDQVSKNPKIDVEKVQGVKYLHEFDRYVQGPTWGYPTEGAYYRDASSVDALMAVRTPLLGINAEDDPIAHKAAIPYGEFKQNPYAVLCTTTMGGHLGSFEIGGSRWFARAASAFLAKMANDIEVNKSSTESVVPKGTVGATGRGTVFDPTHRRLYIPSEADP